MKGRLLFASICIMLCGIWIPSVAVSAEELEEKVGYITDEEFQGVVEEMVSNTFATFATRFYMDWDVPADSRTTSSYFGKAKGSTVLIDVELTKTGRVGIIGTNGVVQYVEGTSIYHTFEIKTTQAYCVFVQNRNSSSLTAEGYYYR